MYISTFFEKFLLFKRKRERIFIRFFDFSTPVILRFSEKSSCLCLQNKTFLIICGVNLKKELNALSKN